MTDNPFREKYAGDADDRKLVEAAVQGDRPALEELISRHQSWIYNIALRMVYHPQDAQDVTQEVLLKIVLHFSTFRGESSFRTWIYRIVANHVLNMKTRKAEQKTLTFAAYGKILDATPDGELPDSALLPVEASMLVEETRNECMMGMLLCLDRMQRLIFILGGLFRISDSVGSEILGISKVNYRQRLARARRDLRNFMESKCGLVDKANPCRCERKTKALIDQGIVDPHNLLYNANYYHRIENLLEEKLTAAGDLFETRCGPLLRGQPFYKSPDYPERLRAILNTSQFQNIFDLRDLKNALREGPPPTPH